MMNGAPFGLEMARRVVLRVLLGGLAFGLLTATPALALEKDPSPLFWEAQEAAEWGDADAQYLVGMMYLDGTDVQANPEEAARWLREAHKQGNPQATYQLGEMYQQGIGVPKDQKLAVEYFKEAGKTGGAPSGVNAQQAHEVRMKLMDQEFARETQIRQNQQQLKMQTKQLRSQKRQYRNNRYYRGSIRSRRSRRYYRY